MALSFVQRTFNVDMYEEIHRKLSEATRELQNTPDAIPESGVEPRPWTRPGWRPLGRRPC